MKKIAFLLFFILILSAVAAFVLNELSHELATSAKSGSQSAKRSGQSATDEVRIRIVPKEPARGDARSVVPEAVPDENFIPLFYLKHQIGEIARLVNMVIEKIRF